MHSLAIVPNLNILKNSGFGFGSGRKLPVSTFTFQCSMEAFHSRIVITIPGSTHTDLAIGVFQQLQVCFARVLASPV